MDAVGLLLKQVVVCNAKVHVPGRGGRPCEHAPDMSAFKSQKGTVALVLHDNHGNRAWMQGLRNLGDWRLGFLISPL